MSKRDGNFEIYVMNIDGCNQKRITNNDVDDWRPSWYNDGTQLLFGSNTNKDGDYRNGDWNIYIMNTDSSSVKKYN
ncbi:TolB family protein [Aquimarina megaterium]|uniref:TolB family protein n=1 Tax=Aquimarina megaterium TaxID=1443666 RepID=UPI000471C537|nr:PD40 domain-containing protein [Aquimarina megaterium]